MILSLPRQWGINHAYRDFGYSTIYRIGDYGENYPLALRQATILYEFIPGTWKFDERNESWGLDPYVWIYYALRPKPATAAVTYVVQAELDAAPPHSERIVVKGDVAVYVRDRAVWNRDRLRRLSRDYMSPLYEPVFRQTYTFFRAYMAQAAATNRAAQPRGTTPAGSPRPR